MFMMSVHTKLHTSSSKGFLLISTPELNENFSLPLSMSLYHNPQEADSAQKLRIF
jgi:hypothetical protein